MAEYYPLLSRAVAGLRDGAPEARQAIYGRARQALVGQLRGMQPPVPEEAITKEMTALDEAIGKIEAEIPPLPSVSDAASAAVEAALLFDAPASPTGPAPFPPEVIAPREAKSPDANSPAAVSPKPPANRPVRTMAPPALRPDRPMFTPRPSLPETRSARAGADLPPVDAPTPPETPAEPVVAASTALPAAATLDSIVARRDEDTGVKVGPDLPAPSRDEMAADTISADVGGRNEVTRPAMPLRATPQPRNLRVWIVAVAALAAVVVIALTAWKLRDKPEELARVPTPASQADNTPGKIIERADGAAPVEDDGQDVVSPAVSSTGQAASVAAAPQAATSVPTPSAGTAAQPASDQTIPVSYKAAVLVAAPDTPEKVRTFVGTVVWRGEGSAQDSATLAVRADVDVPDAKLQMTLELRKNTEAQFPASHTLDIKFTPAPGSTIGGVKQIDVPQMRREDAPTGDPLVGVPVTITNNSFLVGLTRGAAEARNLDAMRSRGWFDIPMVMEDGKPAKITFEKGASGERILADALAAWGKS